MEDFRRSFEEFLKSKERDFSLSQEGLYLFSDRPLKAMLVPVGGPFPGEPLPGTIHIYEDLWRREGENVRKRLLAHLGEWRSIFARNCRAVSLETPQARDFLQRYHTYGTARSKYRYGLMHGDELVAVASFSAGRPMMREGMPVESFEWIRYSSLPEARVCGGMGKLLQTFVEDIHPGEVMSYADLEWSDGGVYRTLGFTEAGRRPPVEFIVDTSTWERISIRKLSNDRKYRQMETSGSYKVIRNLGSVKYLKRF